MTCPTSPETLPETRPAARPAARPATRAASGPAPARSGAADGSPPRSHRVHRAWWVAAVAALAVMVTGALSALPGLLVDPLHEEYAWSRGSIGFAVSVNMVLYGLTAPFAAALMDRFGLRRVVGGALLLMAGGAALTPTMTAAWQLTLYWGLLVGLGTGSLAMAFAATVSLRWFDHRRGLVTGALASASVVGQTVFLPGLAWLTDHHGWRPSVITVALAALAAAPLAALLLRDHPADVGLPPYGSRTLVPKPPPVPGAARRTLRVLRQAARTSTFWLLAAAFAICGASTNGILWTHFTPAAHDHGMPTTVAASLLAGIGVCNIGGTLASGWLTDRYDARRLLAGYFAARGVLLLLLPMLLAPTVGAPMVAFVVLFGLLDLATVPPVIALCREHFGADSSIVFGWVSTGHQVGAALVAVLGGVARDVFATYDVVWVAVGALCAPAALLSLVVRKVSAT
ncbi:MFS transporter [Streptomyces sp. WMMC1477]|uniref:MFS transporter n=1 Tax=Streptomyces sp. WMMC1477 TaxID=3015155 RepID=UPI0022B63B76|nr:MFS transporter [Streptomyces sp. WMMC1477]MCZ7431405.1 MFS transporter [Streptomyces sp. WMMC1477]